MLFTSTAAQRASEDTSAAAGTAPTRYYTFPVMTSRLEAIYRNIFAGYEPIIHWSPLSVTVFIEIDRDDIRDIVDHVDYDFNEGRDWDNLRLDGETLALIPIELPEENDILYAPQLSYYELISK